MEKLNKKIVVIGGGNAMPKAVLAGLKNYPVNLSVISAMLDSGGSAGREREYFKTGISFGDLRRAVLALSEAPSDYKEFLANRYQGGFLEGHVPINIYCTTGVLTEDNLQKGVERLLADLREDLKIPEHYQLLPSTLDNSTLCVELENGEVIRGETNIDVPKHDGNLRIKKVFLEPEAKAYPSALKAIREADLIVIGPGDLYSSLSQILLVEGISEAIGKSRAKKVYICNLMTKHGETNNFTVLDFTTEIEKYLGGLLDYTIYNTQKPSTERLTAQKENHPELLELVNLDERIIPGKKYIGVDLLASSGPLSHDPDRVAKTIISLL